MASLRRQAERNKAKLERERYEAEQEKLTPEQKTQRERKGREAAQLLTAALSLITMCSGGTYNDIK